MSATYVSVISSNLKALPINMTFTFTWQEWLDIQNDISKIGVSTNYAIDRLHNRITEATSDVADALDKAVYHKDDKEDTSV